VTATDSSPEIFDLEAERHTLAAMMVHPSAIEQAAEILDAESFYRPGHRELFRTLILMMTGGDVINPVTIRARMLEDGNLRSVGGDGMYLLDLAGLYVSAPQATAYARIVLRCATRRALAGAGARLVSEASAGDVDEATMIGRAHRLLDQALASNSGLGMTGMTTDEVCDTDIPTVPLIEELLNAQERAVIVGPEGGGKSILGLQMGFASAAGVHPFQHQVSIDPVRVLVLDLENPWDIVQRRFRTFRSIAQGYPGWDDKNLILEHRQGGLNLTEPRDAYALAQLIKRTRAQLVVAGPIYKMMVGIESNTVAHVRLSEFWGRMCEDYGVTLWLEAHPPYGQGGGKREMRPEGSTIWAKWCEFGISLNWANKTHGGLNGGLDWKYFKTRAEDRPWPSWITRNPVPGASWPWIANYDTPVLRRHIPDEDEDE
jgi:hypothetical protein